IISQLFIYAVIIFGQVVCTVRSYDDLKLSIFLFSVSIFCFMAVYYSRAQ
ncbi:hypothetical protein L9F63_016195, partial [Diploptera punctata]